MVQQKALKQDILKVLNLEDTAQSIPAFAIERSRGVSLLRLLPLLPRSSYFTTRRKRTPECAA